MQDELQEERRIAERRWAKRDKQIQRVIANTSGMYGDLQGLIGTSLQAIPALMASTAENEGSNLWKEVHPLRLRSLHRSATTTISPTETGLSNPSIATKLDARYGCVNMAKITKASGQSGMPVPRKGRCGILIIGQSYCGIPGSRVCSTKPSDLRQAFARSMPEVDERIDDPRTGHRN